MRAWGVGEGGRGWLSLLLELMLLIRFVLVCDTLELE